MLDILNFHFFFMNAKDLDLYQKQTEYIGVMIVWWMQVKM